MRVIMIYFSVIPIVCVQSPGFSFFPIPYFRTEHSEISRAEINFDHSIVYFPAYIYKFFNRMLTRIRYSDEGTIFNKENKNQNTARKPQNKAAYLVISSKSSPSVKYRPLDVYHYRTTL